MKIGGQIPWNAPPFWRTSQIYYLMGRRPVKDVLGNLSKDQLSRLVRWLRKTNQEYINLERKSCLDCSLDTLSTRVEFGKVTYSLQTLRSWKRWTHQKSTPKDSIRKRYISQTRRIYFSNRRWTNENPWRRSGPENIHLGTGAPNSRRE